MPLYAFGSNSQGQLGVGHQEDCHRPQPCQFSESTNNVSSLMIRQIVGGGNHTLLVTLSGELYTAGANDAGQQGYNCDSETNGSLRFTRYPWTLTGRIVAAAAGWTHSMVQTDTGSIWTCGANRHGQCGLGESISDSASSFQQVCLPSSVASDSDSLAIAAGLRSSAVVLDHGQVCIFGCYRGRLSGQDTSSSSTPSRPAVRPTKTINYLIPTLLPGYEAVSVACGQHHLVLLSKDRQTLWCFGDNRWHQLGPRPTDNAQSATSSTSHLTIHDFIDATASSSATPSSEQTIIQIGAGWSHTVVLLSSGQVYAWGRGDRGQLGVQLPESVRSSASPVHVPLPGPVQTIAVGSEHNLALLKDGRCFAWGWNEHGNCGTGNTEDVYTPAQVNLDVSVPIRGIGCGYGTSFLWT
jgi:secretion-regulating guanine nucleotide exchange factor